LPIRKTGTYTATATDQQHFAPFGITLKLKIVECDRAIEGATVGTGKVRAILADRKALEQAYKAHPTADEDLLAKFIEAFLCTYGAGKPLKPLGWGAFCLLY
jgi:hypothetical protein